MTAAHDRSVERRPLHVGDGPRPQVVEVARVVYGKLLTRTREYVEIVRTILKREQAARASREYYDIPVQGEPDWQAAQAICIRCAKHPIYVAAIGPKNVALAAEIADGWLPVFFSPKRVDVFRKSLAEGFARRTDGKTLADFDIAPTVSVVVGDDVDDCRMKVKPNLALYIGGMGARGKNFYNELACRYGYEEAAKTIQDLYLAGKKNEAIAAVPD